MNTLTMHRDPVCHLHLTDENDFFMYHTFHILRYFFNDSRFDRMALDELCGNEPAVMRCLEQMTTDFSNPERIEQIFLNETASKIFPKIIAFVCRLYQSDQGVLLEQLLNEDYRQIVNYDYQLFRDGYLRIASRVLDDDQLVVTKEVAALLNAPGVN